MSRRAWMDVSAGVAGDMVLGACVDAGADLAEIEAVVRRIVGTAVALRAEPVIRAGQRATKVHVVVDSEAAPHRTWRSIRADLTAADLPAWTRGSALAVFGVLAEAEGRVHGIDPEDVHFHEVGALDSIADVVGACEGLRQLGVTSVTASPVALGEGRIRTAHGDIPVPVPAVAQLALGWEVWATPGGANNGGENHDHPSHDHQHGPGHAGHDDPAVVTTPGSIGELATPTGMALVRALATACEPVPAMRLVAVGVGAGGRDFAGHPNVVRLLIGTTPGAASPATAPALRELRANVDDMDPRLWPGVLDALLAVGAADAWLTPILMKKGRPAHCLSALADAGHADAVADAMLRHTTTLGVRSAPVDRTVLERGFATVEVEGHEVTVKVGHREGLVVHAAAEFSSVRHLAEHLGAGEAEVLARANAAIVSAGWTPGSPVPAGRLGPASEPHTHAAAGS